MDNNNNNNNNNNNTQKLFVNEPFAVSGDRYTQKWEWLDKNT